jgi:hypothetical protein
MSWLSTNYEKAALGGAVALTLGLAYLGWSKFADVEEQFSAGLTGSGNNIAAVRDADLIPKSIASLKLDRNWSQGTDGDRSVDLFTGIPLFVASSAPDKALDLVEGETVHPPIPNTWWLTYNIDPGFSDSPNRDPDEDGFSNLEEFNAKTDPNDNKSIPPLIAKLTYLRDESVGWVLRPTYGDAKSGYPFYYKDTALKTNKTATGQMIVPEGLFFAKGVSANRFKFLSVETRKEFNVRIKTEQDTTYVKIEDQRPNKKGKVYEYPAPLSEERMNEFLNFDRTAVLSLEALSFKGKEFKVEENTSFALPPGEVKKAYLLKTVTPASITVEYTEPSGTKKTFEIKKGGMPVLVQ